MGKRQGLPFIQENLAYDVDLEANLKRLRGGGVDAGLGGTA